MVLVHGESSHHFPVMREADIANPLTESAYQGSNWLHRSIIPKTENRLVTNLSSDSEIFVGVHTHDIVRMVKHELLILAVGGHHDTDSGGMVDNLALRCVPDIVSGVVAPVAMHVLQLEGGVRGLAIAGAGFVL